jgi:hypothetical protein
MSSISVRPSGQTASGGPCDPAHPLGRVVHRHDAGGEVRRDHRAAEVLHQLVEMVQHLRRLEVEGGEGAGGGAQLAHHRRRAHSVAHDVADHQCDPAAAEPDHVVPVAADAGQVAGGQVAVGDVDARVVTRVGREQRALEHQRGLAFVRVQAGVVDAQRRAGGQFLAEHRLAGGERAAGCRPDEDRQAEHRAARLERHYQQRAAGDRGRHLVAEAGGRLLRGLRVQRGQGARPAGGQRLRERRAGGVGKGAADREDVGFLPAVRGRGQAPQHGPRADRASVRQLVVRGDRLEHDQAGGVGEARHRDVHQLARGGGHVQRRADHGVGVGEQLHPAHHRHGGGVLVELADRVQRGVRGAHRRVGRRLLRAVAAVGHHDECAGTPAAVLDRLPAALDRVRAAVRVEQRERP